MKTGSTTKNHMNNKIIHIGHLYSTSSKRTTQRRKVYHTPMTQNITHPEDRTHTITQKITHRPTKDRSHTY